MLGYDRGRLFVATEDGGKNLGQELFSAQIGPRFNGDMLLEQICDLAGLTLRGEKPVLDNATWRSAAERNWVLDWSGETTYWVGDLQVTEEGGRRLANYLLSRGLRTVIETNNFLEVEIEKGDTLQVRLLPTQTVELTIVRRTSGADFTPLELRAFRENLERVLLLATVLRRGLVTAASGAPVGFGSAALLAHPGATLTAKVVDVRSEIAAGRAGAGRA